MSGGPFSAMSHSAVPVIASRAPLRNGVCFRLHLLDFLFSVLTLGEIRGWVCVWFVWLARSAVDSAAASETVVTICTHSGGNPIAARSARHLRESVVCGHNELPARSGGSTPAVAFAHASFC